jgi:hypothetical protein
LTYEYQQAVTIYRLNYEDLKRMARAALDHDFLQGEHQTTFAQRGPALETSSASYGPARHAVSCCSPALGLRESRSIQPPSAKG